MVSMCPVRAQRLGRRAPSPEARKESPWPQGRLTGPRCCGRRWRLGAGAGWNG